MDFVFFDASDKPVFIRNDAESAEWTVHQLSLNLAFPYQANKVIQRGMRIGFIDAAGGKQLFEIRKAKTYEPDHYQEITAEHIAISELTDDHFAYKYSFNNRTAAQVLGDVLAKTNPYSPNTMSQYTSLWSVGNDTTTDGFTNTITLNRGSIWQCINQIKDAWNVHITPRVTWDESGITGRYLDISPIAGPFRGVVLTLEKNIYQANVQIDDTNVVTAMYGYGNGGLTLSSIAWNETADHPAKPLSQGYIEDAAATAIYGRNGRPRFGFYQNASINWGSTLIEKTWEALKQAREPKITIDGTVRDMYRMGYADQPIMLDDTVFVELRPTGMRYALNVSTLTVDLLDASQTRLTIGKYYPNIIVIGKQTDLRAGASYGSGGGSGNGSGQTDSEVFTEATTESLGQLQQYTLAPGSIKDGDGNMQNVVTWS